MGQPRRGGTSVAQGVSPVDQVHANPKPRRGDTQHPYPPGTHRKSATPNRPRYTPPYTILFSVSTLFSAALTRRGQCSRYISAWYVAPTGLVAICAYTTGLTPWATPVPPLRGCSFQYWSFLPSSRWFGSRDHQLGIKNSKLRIQTQLRSVLW
jgi:hypothetical protein